MKSSAPPSSSLSFYTVGGVHVALVAVEVVAVAGVAVAAVALVVTSGNQHFKITLQIGFLRGASRGRCRCREGKVFRV